MRTTLLLRLGAAGLLALAAPSFPARADQPVAPLGFRPGMVVRFTAPVPVCVSRAKLADLVLAGAKKDDKAIHAMMARGGGCSFLSAGAKAKVLTTEYHSSKDGLGILEIGDPGSSRDGGMWTLALEAEEVAEPAPPPKPAGVAGDECRNKQSLNYLEAGLSAKLGVHLDPSTAQLSPLAGPNNGHGYWVCGVFVPALGLNLIYVVRPNGHGYSTEVEGP